MPKPKPISTIFKGIGKSRWIIIGEKVADAIRSVTESGKDVRGKTFKKLDDKYALRKKAGKFRRQSSTKTSPTDLQLSGDMLRAIQVQKATDNGVIVGMGGAMGARAIHNEENGRIMSDDETPLNAKAEKIAYEDGVMPALDAALRSTGGTVNIGPGTRKL